MIKKLEKVNKRIIDNVYSRQAPDNQELMDKINEIIDVVNKLSAEVSVNTTLSGYVRTEELEDI